MSLRRTITVALVLAIFGVAAYFGYGVIYTWWHIREAYGAWDTGQLLVKYMQMHQDRWPSSWDDLLTVMNTESGSEMKLFGASAGDTNYARSLRAKVSVNWKWDPTHADDASPVTRADGTKFPIVWQGAEPNEMIRAHLKAEMSANSNR